VGIRREGDYSMVRTCGQNHVAAMIILLFGIMVGSELW
jgi:hypothetical protein